MIRQPCCVLSLLLLADRYAQLAELALRYVTVLEAAARLPQVRAAYDALLQRSTAEDAAERPRAAGHAVYAARDTASPRTLREEARTLRRLGREACEAATKH